MADIETPTVPTDTLGAVNQLLRAALLAPVTGLLDAELNADAIAAKQALDAAAVQFQARAGGWEYNREEQTVDPDAEGVLHLPENCKSARCTGVDRDLGFVKRGGIMYDRIKGTSIIGRSVRLELVLLLPFSELPLGARMAIIGRAMQDFAVPKNPTPLTAQAASSWATGGMSIAEQEDAEQADITLPEANPHFMSMRRR